MDFENASHGVNFTGLQAYKDDINMQAFAAIKAEINNTTALMEAVNNGWVGKAADNFISNINTGAQKMSEQIGLIQDMLNVELDGIKSQIADMDENLVEIE